METVIAQATPTVALASAKTLALRLQVTGTSPTTIRAKVWQSEQPEPADWTAVANDSTAALQLAGAVGVAAYASAQHDQRSDNRVLRLARRHQALNAD